MSPAPRGRSFLVAPRVETERLVLRAFDPVDFEDFAATLADDEVVRHLGGHRFSSEDSWRRMATAAGQWSLLGYGYWAVEAKVTGRLVGHVGFADFHREMVPDISGTPEMGWIFDRSVHGMGLAAEAARGALQWIDSVYAPPEVTAIIAPENEPSIRLAEKLGFTRAPDATYRGGPVALFRRSRP